jgi:hypothetical protein
LIDEIINFYRIGKTLRLKTSEISNILSDKTLHLRSNIIFSFIIAAILVFLIVLVSVLGSIFGNPWINSVPDHTYATGTFYSTVKLKDFHKKR